MISLREDFLPLFEPLCEGIPSLRRNRMRLTALSPEQALEAVSRPNPELIDVEVGAKIVQFVADTTEQPFRRVGAGRLGSPAEVEPALLSLVCRELNAARIVQGRERITSDLLDVAKVAILGDFYDRSLADLAAGVREFVEDHLLTRSGFRNVVAMDDALGVEGVTRQDLETLVDRRLLRVEDRLGAQRIELTHDVLTRTIRKSRDNRRARKQEEDRRRHEREEMLSRQRRLEQEHEAQRQKNRRLARLVAGLVGAMAAVLVVAGLIVVLGFYAVESAREAERQREIAENAVSFMLFDLRTMVESSGRMDIAERAAREVLRQTDADDPEALSDSTARTRAVALVTLGDARRLQGDLTTAGESYESAMAISSRLAAQDPDNELWMHDLSVAHLRLGDLHFQEGRLEAALASWREEENISRLLATRSPTDLDRQRELALSAMRVANGLRIQGRAAEANAALADAVAITTDLVANDPANTLWRSDLAHVYEYRAAVAAEDGDLGAARHDCEAALAIRREISIADPQSLLARSLLAGVETELGNILLMEGDLDAASRLIADAEHEWAILVGRDPGNTDWQLSWAAVISVKATVARSRGDLEGAITGYRERLAILEDLAADSPSNATLLFELAATHAWISQVLMVTDRPTAALGEARLALATAEALTSRDAGNAAATRLAAACRQLVGDALLAMGDLEAATDRYRSSLTDMRRIQAEHPDSVQFAVDVADIANRLSRALWRTGEEAAARDAWQSAVAELSKLEIRADAATRRTLEGPLGGAANCTLFRKDPSEGEVIGVNLLDQPDAGPRTRAGVLGFNARRALFVGSPDTAVALATEALELDPNQNWIRLALAHGHLLAGRNETATALYLRYAHYPVSDSLFFREAVLEDFAELRAAGVEIGGMREIEALLRRQPPR